MLQAKSKKKRKLKRSKLLPENFFKKKLTSKIAATTEY